MYTVLKFGGTSMDDERSWRQVIDIVRRYDRPWVVVSATARTTRRLFEAADRAEDDLGAAREIAEEIAGRHLTLIRRFMERYPEQRREGPLALCEEHVERCMQELDRRLEEIRGGRRGGAVRDAVASVGEQLSSCLFAACARLEGLPARWVDARTLIRTDAQFGGAQPDTRRIGREAKRLAAELPAEAVPVMGGYYGESDTGEITTLGMEGSDYSASLVGAALGAEAIEIWTDVSGVYTCDPRCVEEARPLPGLTFREATRLAAYGAKVLHPSTLEPAEAENIPVFVKNIFAPGAEGTRIGREAEGKVPARAIGFRNEGEKGVIGLMGCDPDQREELRERIGAALEGLPFTLSADGETTLRLVTESGRTLEAVRRLHQALFEGSSPA